MYKIKEWSSFQSYKDRSPPWIRLHKKLLDDYTFQRMSVEARALLPMLWLIASEDKDPVSGMLRMSYEEISFRLRQDAKKTKTTLHEIVESGFIEDLSASYGTVTEPLRIDYPETEAYREETEKEKKAPTGFVLPEWIDPADWKDFEEMRRKIKKPMTDRARRGILAKLEKMMILGHLPKTILENSITNSWQDVYEPKGKDNGKPTAKSKLAGEAAELLEQIRAGRDY